MDKRLKKHYVRTKKKQNSPLTHVFYWLLLFSFCLCLWFLWILLTDASAHGNIGDKVASLFLYLLGISAYIFPLVLLYGLAVILLNIEKPHKGILTMSSGIILILLSTTSLINRISDGLGIWKTAGGVVGSFFDKYLYGMFGSFGAVLIYLIAFFAGAQLLFKIPWTKLISSAYTLVKEDYTNWVTARQELREKIKVIAEKEKLSAEPYKNLKPIPEQKQTVIAVKEKQPEPEPVSIIRHVDAPPVFVKNNIQQNTRPGKPTITNKSEQDNASKITDPYYKKFKLPHTNLLDAPDTNGPIGPDDSETTAAKYQLENTFKNFDVDVHVSGIYPGPVVTRYEVTPAPGVKISSIVSLSNDVALAMKSAGAIRVIAPIPGKAAIGFEIPNNTRAKVTLRELLESPEFNSATKPLTVALGRHAEGAVGIANLETMPHLLVAGATASGKSVFMQSLILSLMFRNKPDEVKFLFIDPKRLELTFYEDIPYLYDPKVGPDEVKVITDAADAAKSLTAMTRVMYQRYKKFEKARVKNIASYNKWALENNQPQEYYIIIVVDELADLMIQQKKVVEDAIQRLAQMARAVGIHLVLATQRPSVDVITGVIKANLPTRVALQVASKMDSRVILDGPGADALIGRGDLLYLAVDKQKPERIQGAYVSEEEIKRVADFVKEQARPNYEPLHEEDSSAGTGKGSSSEEMIAALKLIMARRRVSQDLLKAHFGSSARATNILSILECDGFIRKPEGSNRWEIFFDKIESHLKECERKGPTGEEDFIPEKTEEIV